MEELLLLISGYALGAISVGGAWYAKRPKARPHRYEDRRSGLKRYQESKDA